VLDVEVAGTGTDTVTTLLAMVAGSGIIAVGDVITIEIGAVLVPVATLPLAAGLAFVTMTAESMPGFAKSSETSNDVFR
jgi:hypothetical protein